MTTKRIIRISYFVMLTVIGELLKIPVGAVSFTMQTVFVVLSAFTLGGRDGAFSQLVYMLIGLIGLPVFTGGGGFSYVLQPSFGYIIGFSAGAFVTGTIMYSQKTMSTLKIWMSGVAGLTTIYIIGILYQIVILVAVSGITFIAALISLFSIIIYFAVDVVLVYFIALIYPRIMSLIGTRFVNEGRDE